MRSPGTVRTEGATKRRKKRGKSGKPDKNALLR